MKVHLYLSLVPEALVFSMLPPREFGRYLALGVERRTQGQALFFEVDQGLLEETFNLKELSQRCRPHPDGRPHRSSYVSIYRVLEKVPVAALGSFFLVTRDGTALELHKSGDLPPSPEGESHLYQEFCPLTPLVASRLGPGEFVQFLTNPDQAVSVPRLVFVELDLGPLARDPDSEAPTLPYRGISQVRFSLNELKTRPDKMSKIVDRRMDHDMPFWMIKGGVYVGDQTETAFYPVPAEDSLRKTDFNWWSSARAVKVL